MIVYYCLKNLKCFGHSSLPAHKIKIVFFFSVNAWKLEFASSHEKCLLELLNYYWYKLVVYTTLGLLPYLNFMHY